MQCSIEETGEHIIAGAGELHLEICLKDLQARLLPVFLNSQGEAQGATWEWLLEVRHNRNLLLHLCSFACFISQAGGLLVVCNTDKFVWLSGGSSKSRC